MYLPSPKHRFTNGEFNHEDDITQRLLSSPMTPDEQELMHLHCSFFANRNTSNRDNSNTDGGAKKYFWNDIATLQTKMLEYLPMYHPKRSTFTDSESMEADVSYMEFLQPEIRWCRAYRATQDFLQQQQWSESTEHVNFVQGLLDCPPMHLGFHTLAIPEWCYCPLSLPAWCRKNRIDHLFVGASKHQSNNIAKQPLLPYCICKNRSPNAFMAHVEATKRRPIQGVEPDRPVLIEELHSILYVYLMAYYDHYLIPRLHHHGMYPLQSDKYDQGVAAKYARLARWMKLGLKKRQRLQQETLEQEKKLQELQRIKEILHKVLDKKEMEVRERRDALFQKAKEVLGISDEVKAKERQPYSCTEYQMCRQEYLAGAEGLLVRHYIKYKKSSLEKVAFKDASAEYMKKLWEERDHRYLFEDSICEMKESFFVGMDASPHSDNPNEEKAKDEGGPTRQFLSALWRHLPLIIIEVTGRDGKKDDSFKLLDDTSPNYLQPKIDDEINQLQEHSKKVVHSCYRALGRILGFCFLHEYHISNNVLSKIHRNYLLRGLSPKNGYDKSELFYDLKESMGHENPDNKQTFDFLQALLEFPIETDFETKLREEAHTIYIDQNKFFLRAIQDGMRLEFIDADRIPQIFSDIHSWRVDELLFGRTKFDVEDVIAILKPVYADWQPGFVNSETEKRFEVQKKALRINDQNKAEGAFVNVLRSLGANNQDFLATFVFFVTGYDYLPMSILINVEFNNVESGSNDFLPVAHTCDHVLKLPGSAYNADEDLIQTKLTKSLDLFKESKSAFTMA